MIENLFIELTAPERLFQLPGLASLNPDKILLNVRRIRPLGILTNCVIDNSLHWSPQLKPQALEHAACYWP